VEVYATYYDIRYPFEERRSGRPLKLSPAYPRLQALGCAFGEKAGWERPNWFEVNRDGAGPTHEPGGWPRAHWSPAIEAEHVATRARAGLFDLTSFSKLEVSGPGALALLQRLTDNGMDRPVGSVTYTQLLNEAGGIESDLTVTRLRADRFFLVTGSAFGPHDLAWIRSHLPSDGSVSAEDVTARYACVGLWGPEARAILQRVTRDDLSNGAFPYMTARWPTLGRVRTLALRVTYVGELGWELYAPLEQGLDVWDALWEAGRDVGLVAAGYRALDSLRLEKGYRYWSAELTPEYTPWEAGLGFCVRLGKGEFIGKQALLAQRERGVERRLVCLALADPAALALGGEPILSGNRPVGRVTSGGYGYTVGTSIAYGYVPAGCARAGTRLAVEVFGESIPAVVGAEPLYDPRGEKIRA
jgi:4-methylaminobutanoate oxidase (formaldehyde-forming)